MYGSAVHRFRPQKLEESRHRLLLPLMRVFRKLSGELKGGGVKTAVPFPTASDYTSSVALACLTDRTVTLNTYRYLFTVQSLWLCPNGTYRYQQFNTAN
jgi:hypothetical protein